MVASAEKPVCWWEDLLLLWAPGQTGCTLFPGLFLDELAAAWSPLIHLRDGRAVGPPGGRGCCEDRDPKLGSSASMLVTTRERCCF